MNTLKEVLEDKKLYEEVIRDSIQVLDSEVSKKSGLGGMAIKGAYKLLKGAKRGEVLRKVVEVLIPDFIEKLDPYVADYRKEGKKTSLGAFLSPHYDTLADQLLSVTDDRVQKSDNKTVRGTYQKLRPKAKKEVLASMPALSQMVEKYLED